VPSRPPSAGRVAITEDPVDAGRPQSLNLLGDRVHGREGWHCLEAASSLGATGGGEITPPHQLISLRPPPWAQTACLRAWRECRELLGLSEIAGGDHPLSSPDLLDSSPHS
jgi:hypothetical protein